MKQYSKAQQQQQRDRFSQHPLSASLMSLSNSHKFRRRSFSNHRLDSKARWMAAISGNQEIKSFLERSVHKFNRGMERILLRKSLMKWKDSIWTNPTLSDRYSDWNHSYGKQFVSFNYIYLILLLKKILSITEILAKKGMDHWHDRIAIHMRMISKTEKGMRMRIWRKKRIETTRKM